MRVARRAILSCAIVCFVLLAAGHSKAEVLLNQRRQLTESYPTISYAVYAGAGSYSISVIADGPVDWALLPTRANPVFPYITDYVRPFISLGSVRNALSGQLRQGTYYLLISAGSYPRPVTFEVTLTRR